MTNYEPYVLVLNGSKSQMGYRYGELMADRLRQAYDILIQFYVNDHHIPLASVFNKAKVFYQKYPHSYQKFLQAEAKGANMTLEQVQIVNAMETLNSLLKGSKIKKENDLNKSVVCTNNSTDKNVPDGEISGCSFISVPSIKTQSGTGNLVGRNYDFYAPFDQMAKYLTVTVLHEEDHIPTAFIGFVGQIFCATCINQEGIFVEFNNGMPSGGFETDHSVESLLINLLQITQDSANFDQFDTQISALRADYSLVVNVANRTHTKAFEFSAGQKIMRETNFTENSIIASANSFSHSDWESKPTDEECWFGHSRRDNLVNQAELKNIMSISDFKEMLGLTINQGGGIWEYTLYQVVFDSATMQLLIRPKAISENWCAVDLSKAFSENFVQELSGMIAEDNCHVIM